MPWRAASAALTNVTVPSFGTSHTQRVLALAWALSANGSEIARVAIPTLTFLFILPPRGRTCPQRVRPSPIAAAIAAQSKDRTLCRVCQENYPPVRRRRSGQRPSRGPVFGNDPEPEGLPARSQLRCLGVVGV